MRETGVRTVMNQDGWIGMGMLGMIATLMGESTCRGSNESKVERSR